MKGGLRQHSEVSWTFDVRASPSRGKRKIFKNITLRMIEWKKSKKKTKKIANPSY